MKITNNTKSLIHFGEIVLQPGENEAKDELKAVIESSAFLKSFAAEFTDFIPSDVTDTTKMSAQNAVKFVSELTDLAILQSLLQAEQKLNKKRATVVAAITARIAEIQQAIAAQQNQGQGAQAQQPVQG